MEVKVYLSIPIAYREHAERIEEALSKSDIKVLNPCKIVHGNWPKQEIPRFVAEQCWRMIEDSYAVIIYTEYYGRDCSAEIGYAYGKSKPVFPFYLYHEPPFLQEDWMVKSWLEPISEGLSALAEKIHAKYVESSHASFDDETRYVEHIKV